MIAAQLDHLLTRLTAARREPAVDGPLPTRRVRTFAGNVRVFDSGTPGPCLVLTPDGPNVIEHYEQLIALLVPRLRVVCFDLPGFGHSLPSSAYTHSLDDGARVVLAVLDALGIPAAALAFSCANGFYALRTAQLAPRRVTRLVLAQTPSVVAMHAWKRRIIPWPLTVPLLGQAAIWLLRERSARGWYESALPRHVPRGPFRARAQHAFDHGACWCLASITQGLARENVDALHGIAAPCTLVWGAKDRTHRHTAPESLNELVPGVEIVRFADSGHFPELEAPDRYARLVIPLLENT
ncbi:MAG: alpha/beta hydrolase [Candidatus Didemnitutus sp.]|nr:alpha/beta hydrolase [Candidatus Didemnitutus sp.]